MSDTLALIDRLIAEHLAPRQCRRRRGRCQCGHIDIVHEGRTHGGPCAGSHGRCRCRRFVPYDYRREQQALLNRHRAFAFALLAAYDAARGAKEQTT